MEKTNLIINSTVDIGDNIEIETNGKGRKFVSRFIEAGVAHYEQFGDVLITKETLDKFIQSMVGCPVIIKHKDITDKNADKERVGVVSRVWFNEQDGWYYCEGIIWDKQAIDLVKNQGWNVSCTYDFESDKQPKTHNGKKVDMEFTDGEFLHLALVPNPRYERANIVINSNADIIENEDKWITIKPNGEDGKGKHLLLKDGETPKEAIERTFGKGNKEDKKESAIEKRHKFQEVKKNRDEVYKEFEKGNGSLEDIEKADKEYEKAYKEFYGGSDTDKKEDKKEDNKFFENFGFKKDEKDKSGKRWHLKKDGEMHTIVQTMPDKYRYNIAEWDDKKGGGKEIFDKTSLSEEELKKEIYKELKGKKDKANNSLISGLETILDEHKPEKTDLPILEGLRDIFKK